MNKTKRTSLGVQIQCSHVQWVCPLPLCASILHGQPRLTGFAECFVLLKGLVTFFQCMFVYTKAVAKMPSKQGGLDTTELFWMVEVFCLILEKCISLFYTPFANLCYELVTYTLTKLIYFSLSIKKNRLTFDIKKNWQNKWWLQQLETMLVLR